MSWEARNIICHWLGRDVANKKIPTALHIFEGDTLHQKRTQVRFEIPLEIQVAHELMKYRAPLIGGPQVS